MIWIVLAILSSTSIFVVFKLLQRFNIPTLQVIVVNYVVAGSFGFALAGGVPVFDDANTNWLLPAIVIGALFIVNFFLIGYSSQNIGISITTVAGKMSVIFPMVFSIWFYSEALSLLKISGIILALISVFMAVYSKTQTHLNSSKMLVPLIIFVLMGITDALVKYAQDAWVNDSIAPVFSASLFSIALICGLLYMMFVPKKFAGFLKWQVWVAGIVLGLVNFGSIYFIILSLNSNVFDSSIVFGIVNICIVSLSVIIGRFIFNEILRPLNIIGIVLSVIAIFVFMLS